MSNTAKETFADARESALAFYDRDMVSMAPSKPIPLSPLKPTSAITVTGYIPANAIRFSINLICKSSGNIALHFNGRLDRGYVVRNTKFRGSWEEEETCSPSGLSNCVFQRNSYVHITIFCTNDAFQIAVNGEHFCAFAYRMHLDEVASLEVNGSLEDVRMCQTELSVYPDPNTCKSEERLILTVKQTLANELLNVPVTIDIGEEFAAGKKLFITGRLKLLPHSFYVNLQNGRAIYPHPVIALHLNPRFLYGTSAPYVVMNCWTDGSWGKEERHHGQLSWMPGREFELTIHCEVEAYTIWLGKKMIGEFKHRLRPSIINTLRISGDVVLSEIQMTSSTVPSSDLSILS